MSLKIVNFGITLVSDGFKIRFLLNPPSYDGYVNEIEKMIPSRRRKIDHPLDYLLQTFDQNL